MSTIRTLAAAACLASVAATAQAETYGIGTLPQGSLGYSIAAASAKVVSEQTGLDVRAIGQGGSTVYLPQINSGEIAFGTSNTFESTFARNGTGNFEGRPLENLRLVTALMPFQVSIMVRRDSGIDSFDDLKGQPFPDGYSSQRLVGVMQDAIFAGVGLSVADLEPVPVPNFVKGAELLGEGKVAGVLLAPGSGVVAQTDAKTPVRFLGIPGGEATEAKIAALLPASYLTEVAPSPRMPYITEPVTMLGYEYTIVTHKDVAADVVYRMVEAIHGNKDALGEAHGVFKSFDPARMAVQVEGIDYHPGAVKFFKEKGIWTGAD